ncbi:MAG: 4'-phosphopantetheinyl transferase superfamily protein [Eikenella sp.]|nr:4'-phosphopantetheinyl transferase superfamily protein [Eikenella sp.]
MSAVPRLPETMSAARLLTVCLAAEDCAAGYRADALCAPDRRRLAEHPQLAKRPDWQTSRFLRRIMQDDGCGCLSHSGGCAAWSPAGSGIDLETLRPRRFNAWAELVCSADEQNWLRQHGATTEAHYLLWTLKEALLKAAGLTWADLPRVGLRRRSADWVLTGGGQNWYGEAVRINRSHLAACVWPPALADTVYWQAFGAWQQADIQVLAAFRQPVCLPHLPQVKTTSETLSRLL